MTRDNNTPPLAPLELPGGLYGRRRTSSTEQKLIANAIAQDEEISRLEVAFFAELRRRKALGLE